MSTPSPIADRLFIRHLGAWRSVLVLVSLITVLRFIYLLWLCPYDLTEDEAFYWDWSRHLAWSYNTKGPGIAWAIWLATQILGDTVLAVRSVALVSSFITMLAAGGLAVAFMHLRVRANSIASATSETGTATTAHGLFALPPAITRDERSRIRTAGLIGAALIALLPGYQATSILSTIDAPYLACWMLASCFAVGALLSHSRVAWLGLGLTLAIGFLFKYTILLLPLGLLVFAVLNRRRLNLAPTWRRSLIASLGLLLLGLLPVIIWNAQHDWATLRHLLSHLNISLPTSAIDASSTAAPVAPAAVTPPPIPAASTWTPMSFAEFIASQLGLLGLFAPIIILLALLARTKPKRSSDPALSNASTRATSSLTADAITASLNRLRAARSLLIWAGLPVLAFYTIIAIKQETEGNWPLAGYLTLLPIAAAWITTNATRHTHTDLAAKQPITTSSASPLATGNARPASAPRIPFFLWHATLILGLITGLGMLRLDLVQAALAQNAPVAAKAIPMSRLLGAPTAAHWIDQQVAILRQQTGKEPFILVEHYGRASQLAFYINGQPQVVCASSFVGGRRVQQDFWPECRPDSPALLGRPAIIIDEFNREPVWAAAFENVTPTGEVPGLTRSCRFGFIARNYRGMKPPTGQVGY